MEMIRKNKRICLKHSGTVPNVRLKHRFQSIGASSKVLNELTPGFDILNISDLYGLTGLPTKLEQKIEYTLL